MSLLRPAALAAVVLLAGCDAAEQTAQKLAEEARQQVEQTAREAINDTARQLNEKIDQAQKSTEQWLDGQPGQPAEAPEQRDERKPERERDEVDEAQRHSA